MKRLDRFVGDVKSKTPSLAEVAIRARGEVTLMWALDEPTPQEKIRALATVRDTADRCIYSLQVELQKGEST